MAAPALWFHVGLGKCASRLVANCTTHRDMIWDGEARQPLSDWLHEGEPPSADVCSRLMAIMDRWCDAPGPHFVSREPLSGLRWMPGSVNFTAATVEWIETLCADRFEIGVLMVVRRQDTYFESLYNQEVVDGEARPFDEWLRERPFANFRWHEIAETFDGAGLRTVVLPMERELLALAGYNNLVEAARHVIGVKNWRTANITKIYNPSIAPECLELMRQANAFLPPKQRRGLAEWFMQNTPRVPGSQHGLLLPSKRAEIIDEYARGNQRLKEFFPKPLRSKGLTIYSRGGKLPPVATKE